MITPYSKITTIELWTNPYIAKRMLETHLNPDVDAASRKPATIVNTVEFINSYLKEPKTICDYGCGPGLYANLLEQKGHSVIGLDISEVSLEYARKHNSNVDYRKMNYINEELDAKVDFAMMIYCDFGALHPNSQVQVLKNISKALTNDGYFMFDVMSEKYFDKQVEGLFESSEVDGFYMPGNCNIKTQTVKYEKMKLLLRHHKAVGTKTIEFYNWDKSYNEREMKVLLADNGFEIVEVFSNTYGEKDFSENEIITFMCRKVQK